MGEYPEMDKMFLDSLRDYLDDLVQKEDTEQLKKIFDLTKVYAQSSGVVDFA